jgi:hypothetical protein
MVPLKEAMEAGNVIRAKALAGEIRIIMEALEESDNTKRSP